MAGRPKKYSDPDELMERRREAQRRRRERDRERRENDPDYADAFRAKCR